MDIVSRKYGIASLIALILIAFGFNAAGAEYSLGSESDDWWTEYPDQSTGAGGDVSHPDWVLDALESKPVLIYVHKECDYCVPQTEAVQKIIDEFSGEITIFELGADGSD
ncbi:MAG: thioredoxin family protein, partial [Methanothrix soehngenii]|nr:thioredoxin family protein [Methanothrix soehngenii]